jgi:hypothetical protein
MKPPPGQRSACAVTRSAGAVMAGAHARLRDLADEYRA